MITLPPLAEIKAKALAALEAGQLQCQRPDFDQTQCCYTGPCAIGIALTPKNAAFLDEIGDNIKGLIYEGKVEINPADADQGTVINTLSRIQIAHDIGAIDLLRERLQP